MTATIADSPAAKPMNASSWRVRGKKEAQEEDAEQPPVGERGDLGPSSTTAFWVS